MAGYEEPGFKGAGGLAAAAAAAPGTGAAASRRGVADGVADFEIADESADPGRCVSCRMVAGRGCKLKTSVRENQGLTRTHCLRLWRWRTGRCFCDNVEVILYAVSYWVREQMVESIPRRPRPLPLPRPYRPSPAVDSELRFDRYPEPGQQAPSRRGRRSRRLLPPWFAILNRVVGVAEARSND